MTPRDNRIFQFHWRKQKCLSLVRPNPHWIGLFTKFLFWCLSFTSDIYSIYPIPFTKGIFITYQDSWLFQKQLSTTKRCRLFANQSVMLIFEKKLIFFTIIVNAHDCMFFFLFIFWSYLWSDLNGSCMTVHYLVMKCETDATTRDWYYNHRHRL